MKKLKDLNIMKLSFSKIKTYLECPLKYYFIYILNLKPKPKSYLSFGKTIHLTLSEFHKLPPYPSFNDLKNIYQEKWISEGFPDKEQEENEFKKGLLLLKKYYAKNIFNYNKAFMVETEVNFKIKDILVTGFIDRIDKYNNEYEIIEYKTGKNSTDYNSIGLVDESNLLQMSIYYLAFKYQFKKNPKNMLIYYLSLDKDEKIPVSFNNKILKETIKIILYVYKNILDNNFYKKENEFCRYCDFIKECKEWKR
ncbi:MAG: RecB family exonuclease [Caldisericia bacterium]